MHQPFKIGQRIFNINGGYTAAVIEFTDKGFYYKLDVPINYGSRIGISEGGECYEWGFFLWEPFTGNNTTRLMSQYHVTNASSPDVVETTRLSNAVEVFGIFEEALDSDIEDSDTTMWWHLGVWLDRAEAEAKVAELQLDPSDCMRYTEDGDEYQVELYVESLQINL